MKTTVAKRIKSARIIANLSLRELSRRMDSIVSHNAIKNYEDGLMMPDSHVLINLAKALNVKSDYFFRPFTVDIENIEFRKKSKTSKKALNSIRETVTNAIERYVELEQYMNLSSAFHNPVANHLISNGGDVEEAVLQLLSAWMVGYNAIPNVIELLEDKEIKAIEIEADNEFDGLSCWANDNIPVIVVNKKFPPERKRLTVLHELGHLLLTFNPDLESKTIEKLCYRFAGAMLIPKETFLVEMGNIRSKISLPELIAIKETYGISIQAIMARALDLGVINEERFMKFRKWLNSSEDRKKEIGMGEYISREHSSRFKQLLYHAASEEIISMSKAANLANMKLAEFRDELVAI
ncbi:MAG TPA: ImmA/IrrE family metallo-endopeptidase [Bacteroidales bacterium]|nr:ImmA/IrrE family metallo-endopeptidase [Bacteroidales bacterium]